MHCSADGNGIAIAIYTCMEYTEYKGYAILFNDKYDHYLIYIASDLFKGKAFDFRFKTVAEAIEFIDNNNSQRGSV